jgi:hypothetical protein
LGHDPGKKDEENKKKEGPEKGGFASEELDVFIIRPFDIHSSHPVYYAFSNAMPLQDHRRPGSKYINVSKAG